VQLLQDSAICRLTSFCDLPCRLSFPHSAFYLPFRKPFRIFGFRILLSAFRILPITVIFIKAYKSLNSQTPALPHYTQCKRLVDYIVTW